MKELLSGIDIDVGADTVWSILADFDSYPDWNPFIRKISGEARVGGTIEVRIQPPGARGMTFKPKVLVFEAGREIRWLGRLMVPGLFDGEHALEIEPLEGGGVRFVQRERFTGMLVPWFSRILESTLLGFEAMNRALKEKAESQKA